LRLSQLARITLRSHIPPIRSLVMAQVAFVIGAGPGIATGVAALFASRGYSIGFSSRSQSTCDTAKQAISSHNVKVATAPADTADIPALIKALDSLESQLGAPSIILYNVSALALARKQTPLLEFDPADLGKFFTSGVRGGLVTAQWAAKHLTAGKDGKKSLFYTGGGLSKQPRPGFEGLAMDKAALESLTKALVYTFKNDDIHVGLVNVTGLVKDDDKKWNKELIAEEFAKLHDEEGPADKWTREVMY